MIEIIQKFFSEQINNANFIQGILVELFGGFLFLVGVLYLLRPHVIVSPKIAKYTVIENGVTRTKYSIKVINKSIYDAFDIVGQLYYFEYIPASPNGFHKQLQYLNLTLPQNPHLSGNFWLSKVPFLGDALSRRFVKREANFAVWFSTYEDIESLLNRNSVVGASNVSLEFKVILKHGLTSLANSKEQSYSSATNHIIEGKFELGNSFKIV
jgi:hypothetical protein